MDFVYSLAGHHEGVFFFYAEPQRALLHSYTNSFIRNDCSAILI